MKYVCNVCGWVYDEDETGVKWEELPEDFACELPAPPGDFQADRRNAYGQAKAETNAEEQNTAKGAGLDGGLDRAVFGGLFAVFRL